MCVAETMEHLLTDDVELVERFRKFSPNQEADVEFMADVAAFEMYNRVVEQNSLR